MGPVGRVALLLAAVATAILLGPAAPAWAHGADAPDGTNFRTAVTAVAPTVDGLELRAVEAGARLELTNRTGRTIEVLGYRNEPYLEVRPDGVYENVHSPATYLNVSLTGDAPVPPAADPTQPPSWRRLSTTPVARWHDHRTHWMSATLPPPVSADPDRPHRIRDWVVPLRDQLSIVEARGTLDWVPPPFAAVWWIAALAGAVLLGLLGLAWDRALPILAAVAAGVSLTALGYAVARELDAGNRDAGAVLAGLLSGQVLPVLIALAGLVAAVYALRRGAAADLALGLAGACLALIAGATNGAVFARGVAPVPWDAVWARVATAAVLAGGAGLAIAAALRLRALSRANPRPAPDSSAPDSSAPEPSA